MSRQTFSIPITSNPLIMMRRFGYAPYSNRHDESSFVRRLTGYDFPRFHLYVQDVGTETLMCSLHIDQKAPVIKGATAHAGDYDSPQVFSEIARLQGAET